MIREGKDEVKEGGTLKRSKQARPNDINNTTLLIIYFIIRSFIHYSIILIIRIIIIINEDILFKSILYEGNF